MRDARHHDLAHLGIGQLEDVVDHLALVFFEHALLFANLDQQAQLLLSDERAATHRLAAKDAHDAGGDEGEHGDHRAQDDGEQLDRPDEEARPALRRLYRRRLRCDLAKD